jgi:hypothetical protein
MYFSSSPESSGCRNIVHPMEQYMHAVGRITENYQKLPKTTYTELSNAVRLHLYCIGRWRKVWNWKIGPGIMQKFCRKGRITEHKGAQHTKIYKRVYYYVILIRCMTYDIQSGNCNQLTPTFSSKFDVYQRNVNRKIQYLTVHAVSFSILIFVLLSLY